jgi:hypothetical protein
MLCLLLRGRIKTCILMEMSFFCSQINALGLIGHICCLCPCFISGDQTSLSTHSKRTCQVKCQQLAVQMSATAALCHPKMRGSPIPLLSLVLETLMSLYKIILFFWLNLFCSLYSDVSSYLSLLRNLK